MIFKIYPQKDTSITNFNKSGVQQTGSNVGASETLSLFKRAAISGTIGAYATSSLARVLMKFDFTQYHLLTGSGDIPSSGATWHLVLHDAQHDMTLPFSYDVEVLPLTRAWDEGRGVDVDYFTDAGFANWVAPVQNVSWTTPGGDADVTKIVGYHFDDGHENLDVDVTSIVRSWVSGTLANNGFMVRVSSSLESNTEWNDYYIKKFFAKNTGFLDRRPALEARWDCSNKDNRSNFVFDYTGSLYLYNRVRGVFTDLPNSPSNVYLRVVDRSGTLQYVTGSAVSTGIYSASFAIASASYSGSLFNDIWFSGTRVFMTGNFTPSNNFSDDEATPLEYFVSMPNLKNKYENDEKPRLNLYVRPSDYNPAVVATASFDSRGIVMQTAYYRIDNDRTNETVIPFGTGSVETTRLSYDENGNYFRFFMSALSPGEVYRIVYLFVVDGERQIIDQNLKFKIVGS